MLAKYLIFSIKNHLGENIELVDFPSNQLIGIVAGSHKINRFFYLVQILVKVDEVLQTPGRWTALIA